MGTPCRCCGKVICKSEEIRFDHDRYNYNGSIAFIHLVQTISHNIDGGGYQQQSREEYFFQDAEPTACNLTVEKEEALEGANPPVMVKTETSIVRKFALRYSINDVYDWGKSNRADHDFINSIFIRAGNEDCDSFGSVPVGPLDVPGLGLKQVDAEGRLYIASGRNIDLQSMQDWNNLASGKPSYDFSCENQDEIFIEKEDINENNEYYILVECPEPSDKIARWGRWFDITKRAFIELRRITDVGASSASLMTGFSLEKCQDQPVLQDHSISSKEDLDDWHTLFTRTADGTYVSNNTYMDKEFNFGDFFKTDWQDNVAFSIPDKFFAFCGELQVGFLNPAGGEYLDLLYKIDYNRQSDYVMPIEFSDGCAKGFNDHLFTSDSVAAEFTDPLNPAFGSDKITITKSKSELGQAPTDIFSTSSGDRVGDYVTELYEFTPPHNNNVLRLKYNVVGGEDRFNGADYILTEVITDYSNCDDLKFLKQQQFDNTWVDKDPIANNRCPSASDYFETDDTYSAFSGGRLKETLIQADNGINGIFIRPCVIESSRATIVSDGSDRRMFDTDIIRSYRYVPHYGEYKPAVFRFTIRNYEFYPYKLKFNDINDACPKECVPTEHIPEWQLLESSFSCAGSPAPINEMVYGTAGGLGLNNNADIFVCCTKLSSDRQLMSCTGRYSINTSYAMRVANYVASSPSVFDPGGAWVCGYPKCTEFHREKDKLAIPNIYGCLSAGSFNFRCLTDYTNARTSFDRNGTWRGPAGDFGPIPIGNDDVCYDGGQGSNFKWSPQETFRKFSNLHPSFTLDYAGLDGTQVQFVDNPGTRTFSFAGSTGYYSNRNLFEESEYNIFDPNNPFGAPSRKAGKNLSIFGTVADDAPEYSTGQFEYAKTCLEKSLDVEGYEIENEFAENHNICVNEVSFGETFSLDKEVQKDKSDGFNARQQSDVVLQDPDCGKGLRWRVNTDDIGIYEALFDYDEDEDVSHACYFYERDDLDLVYQDFVPVIEFEDGIEGAARMRTIAACVGKYLATLAADEQFDYWYELNNDVTLALQPGDNGYSKTEIRSDEAGIQVLEIHKKVGDLVELGEKVFTMKSSDINIRSEFGSGIVTTIVKPEGSIVSAGDLVMTIRIGDSIKSVLAPEDGEISAINVVRGDNVSMNQILAVMITKKTIASPVEGAISSIEVEVGDIVFNTQLMASVVSTVTFPRGSYVKVTPDGNFDGPFANHSMFKNENHYEVKDEVSIRVDGVWAKGKPAEGKKNIHLGNGRIMQDSSEIPQEITHQGDGYKFTYYDSQQPSAHAYDYGVKDDKAPEMGDAPSEYFSDFFVPVLDELISNFREISPLVNDLFVTNSNGEEILVGNAGDCVDLGFGFGGAGIIGGDMVFGDDVLGIDVYSVVYSFGVGGRNVFEDRHSSLGNQSPPCGYMIEDRLDGGTKYKTQAGNIVQGTSGVSVTALEDRSEFTGFEGRRIVQIMCYGPNFQDPNDKRTSCRNVSGTLNFCDPCQKDFSCTYGELGCPSNFENKTVRGFDANGNFIYFAIGTGLWDIINSGNTTDIELATSSRQGTGDGWDHKYDLGDSADASYGETETYRCLKLDSTMSGVEITNLGDLLKTVYRKIVLKSEFNKCGDDRLPNLDYTHKDLIDADGDDKSFPQAVITSSVDLSAHEISIDDYNFTAEKKQKINEALSELDKKLMRGDVDAPINVFSDGGFGASNDGFCGEGVNFLRQEGDNTVDCKLENFIPDLHGDKFGTVINHTGKVNAFYEAVDDNAVAAHLLRVYLYGSANKLCDEHMEPAFREGFATFM